MSPGGSALICLPTRHVMLYEILSNLLRNIGFETGKVSAQPGIKHFKPQTFQRHIRCAGFSDYKVIPVYGWPILIFKTITCWTRVFLHLAIKEIQRFSIKKKKKRIQLYKSRKVDTAINFIEREKIIQREIKNQSIIDKLFLLVVKILIRIDKLTGKQPVVEFIVLLKK